MRDEAEVEIIDSAEHCEGGHNHNSPSETGALVEVSFQKNPNQVLKYLEAEPKVLGVTQILLSSFLISISITSLQKSIYTAQIIFCSLSTVGIIAGSVAIAAQNLRLPKIAYDHVKGLEMLVLGAQIAISATLSAFCCKVIQCCSPRSSIPTIVLNAASAPQRRPSIQ
ncbi:uncharacterized protein LOC107197785 isoform X2 [Astyanax mexicanus]|uniref:uncharacterized protein LOC107197785 isoform X2 n=1 Tax=Astyanax mexicanus TaxID=7994 RepID=UPI0020CB5F6C|nr:uncharacterized protein LOC107197785 isoform X2 [Astyanax mexicanus]